MAVFEVMASSTIAFTDLTEGRGLGYQVDIEVMASSTIAFTDLESCLVIDSTSSSCERDFRFTVIKTGWHFRLFQWSLHV